MRNINNKKMKNQILVKRYIQKINVKNFFECIKINDFLYSYKYEKKKNLFGQSDFTSFILQAPIR